MNTKREQVGQVEIVFTYLRHLGPRMEHGSVKLRFDSHKPYSFSSSVARWGKANYDTHIKAGIEKALREKFSDLETTRVELVGVEIDEINSTPHGFESAAYAATRAAFLV